MRRRLEAYAESTATDAQGHVGSVDEHCERIGDAAELGEYSF
jgi:hypothetical protein